MAELTAELIVDLANPTELSLSPDGKWVAYVRLPMSKKEEHPRTAIWLAPTDGSQPPRPFTADTSDNRRPQWQPEGKAIAFLSDRAKRGTAQLYLIALDGGEARPLTDAKNKRPVLNFAWSPDGAHIAFTSADEPTEDDERREKEKDDALVFGDRLQHAHLRLLNVVTGNIKTLVSMERHIAEFAWSPNSDAIAYFSWQSPALEFAGRDIHCECISINNGTPQRLCQFNYSASRLTWARDGSMLLFLAPTARKVQSSSAVWAVSAEGGEPRRIALSEDSCASDVQQPPQAARAVVSIGVGLGTQLAWLDPHTGSLEKFYSSESETWTGEIASSVVRTLPNGETVIAAARSSGAEPWEVWSAHVIHAESHWRKLSNHQTALSEVRFGAQEPFYWSAPDGLVLDGLLIRPPDAPREPLPLFVLVHGGPYGRFAHNIQLTWANWAQWLALAGYAVLLPNPRGGFGHGETFAAAARGDVGGKDYLDVMVGVDAVIERGIADPERMAIGGWSQGGFMTAWAVTQTHRFKAGIMGAGVSDWGTMVTESDVPDFERELGGSAPWDGVGPLRHTQLSPISFARNVKTPVLILHGEKDARVPVTQAIGFHRALREVGAPTELVIYPREPHGIGEHAHQLDLLRRVRVWCERWVKA